MSKQNLAASNCLAANHFLANGSPTASSIPDKCQLYVLCSQGQFNSDQIQKLSAQCFAPGTYIHSF